MCRVASMVKSTRESKIIKKKFLPFNCLPSSGRLKSLSILIQSGMWQVTEGLSEIGICHCYPICLFYLVYILLKYS